MGCCWSGSCYGRCARRVNGTSGGIFDGAKFRFHDVSSCRLGGIDRQRHLRSAKFPWLALCLPSAICDSDDAICGDECFHRIDHLVCAVGDSGRFLRAHVCDDGTCLRAIRPQPILVVRAVVRNGVVVGGARSRGRAGHNLDVMVIVAEGVPVSVAGLFHVEKTLAVCDGDDDSTDCWGDCIASVGLWLAAKSNVLAGMGRGCCPAVSGS